MSTEKSPRIGLDYVMAAQAQKHVTVNETFRRLDTLVQAGAISASVLTEPSDPGDGDIYVLPDGVSGPNWSQMQAGSLAAFRDGEWSEIGPATGWRIWIADEARLKVFDGSAWHAWSVFLTDLQNLQALGVGTEADTANPFAAKLNAALWTALAAGEGGSGDLRYTMNKEAESNVLSLLFQTAYSGRAEIGLIGDDHLAIKLSDDGANWQEVLRATPDRMQVEAQNGLWLESLNGAPLSIRRNLVINGDFVIAQRGAEFLSPVVGDYFLDRWKYVFDGGMSCEFQQRNFAPGQSDVPGNPRHYLEWRLSGTATGNPWIEQRIEGADRLPEGAATLSIYADASRAVSMVVRIRRQFGSGGSATEVLAQHSLSLSAGWHRKTVPVSVPSLSGKTLGADHCLSVEFYLVSGETDVEIRLADIQLETGNTSTLFERRPEWDVLRDCQRYFAKTYSTGTAPGGANADGQLTTSTSGPNQTAVFDWRLPVQMRTAPTATAYSPASGASAKADASGADIPVSIVSTSPNGIVAQSDAHASIALATLHLAAEAEL